MPPSVVETLARQLGLEVNRDACQAIGLLARIAMRIDDIIDHVEKGVSRRDVQVLGFGTAVLARRISRRRVEAPFRRLRGQHWRAPHGPAQIPNPGFHGS